MTIKTAKRIAKLYKEIEVQTAYMENLKHDGMHETRRFHFYGVPLSEGIRKTIVEMAIYEGEKKLKSLEKELDAIKLEKE